MFTLLIWEIIPEDNKLFLIPNHIANQYRQHFNQAQNKFSMWNGDRNKGLEFLTEAVSDDGIFHQYLVSKEKPIVGNITSVYLSGFVL